MLRLPLCAKDVKPEKVLSRINDDAILGVPFLMAQNCSTEFNQPIVHIDEKKLVY